MRNQRGFTLTEILVSFALLMVGLLAAASALVTGAKLNRSQQLTVDVQSTTRNTLSVVVQALRSAGWDPLNNGPSSIPTVALDPDPSDDISEITIFANLNGDLDLNDDGETLTIRHVGDRVEWRRFAAPNPDPEKTKFHPIGVHITNDEDGDGTPEPMFTPVYSSDIPPKLTRIVVKITGQSTAPDLTTGRYIRYTATSEVLLRRNQWI